MSQNISVAPTSIHPLTDADLDVVQTLLSNRDGRAWSEDSTRWFVHGLDPQRCRAWAAFSGEVPIGLTTVFLRDLADRGAVRRFAYWANLYVDPLYRDRMLYPRLPLKMLQDLKHADVEGLYGAVRLPQLAKAHLGLGFTNLGRMEVLVCPLRPARFLAKYKHLGVAAQWFAAPADAVYRAASRLTDRGIPSEVEVDDSEAFHAPLDEFAELKLSRVSDRIVQRCSVELLRERYRQTREGGAYRIVSARRRGELTAAAAYRVAERGDGIRVGVIMDLIFRERADGLAILRTIYRSSYDAGCELLLCLDGPGSPDRNLLKAAGFRPSPEVYEFLLWPKSAVVDANNDWNRWSFSFADHDAF